MKPNRKVQRAGRRIGIVAALTLLIAAAMSAETERVVPQPRLRLDPVTRAKAVAEERGASTAETNGPMMLERIEVKEERLPLSVLVRRPAVDDPKEKWSLWNGGRLSRSEGKLFRVEFGMWPTIELFAEEARFAKQATQAKFDFVRVKW